MAGRNPFEMMMGGKGAEAPDDAKGEKGGFMRAFENAKRKASGKGKKKGKKGRR